MGNGLKLSIRKVTLDDAKFLWVLRNQTAVRKNSFNTKKVPYHGHEDWLVNKIADRKFAFYLITKGREPIGQIRFDQNGKKSLVNISISKKFTGQGFGKRAIEMATKKYVRNTKRKKVIAYAKEYNVPSIRSFEGAGYENRGKVTVQGNKCIRLVYSK